MGVTGFLSMLRRVFPFSINNFQPQKTDYVFVDGNCILHTVARYINRIHTSLDEIFLTNIECEFKKIFALYEDSKSISIVFDGVPPEPKQHQQKKRRIKNSLISRFFLPNTMIMNTIEQKLNEVIKNNRNIFINSSNENGEGEQKIIINIKEKNQNSDEKIKVLIISLDSDMIILCLVQFLLGIFNTTKIEIWVETEKSIFNVNYIYEELKRRSWNVNKLLLLCVICGNDFFPKLKEYENLSCTNIFYEMEKYNINNFHDIISNRTACTNEKCKTVKSQKKIELYLNTYKWYIEYFKSNKNISCEAFVDTISPCIECLSKYYNEEKNMIGKKINVEEHLSNVLPKDFH